MQRTITIRIIIIVLIRESQALDRWGYQDI